MDCCEHCSLRSDIASSCQVQHILMHPWAWPSLKRQGLAFMRGAAAIGMHGGQTNLFGDIGGEERVVRLQFHTLYPRAPLSLVLAIVVTRGHMEVLRGGVPPNGLRQPAPVLVEGLGKNAQVCSVL